MKPKVNDIIIIGEDGFALEDNILDIAIVVEIRGELYLKFNNAMYGIPINQICSRLVKKFRKIGEL